MDRDTLNELANLFEGFAREERAGGDRAAEIGLPVSRAAHEGAADAWEWAAAWCRDAAAGTAIEVDTRPAVPARA